MSNRTTVEFNHDYEGRLQDDISWPDQLCRYLRSGSVVDFPGGQGIKLIKTQHHSDKDLISDFEWRLGEKDAEIERLQAENKRLVAIEIEATKDKLMIALLESKVDIWRNSAMGLADV